ncbi:MAG: sulfotransferase [Microcoleus sp. PH2017_22_RUC_O_B]|uniref:sulfotransferase family protein n=1 Tax=unclassified Microcoleus TaxID=2642155 RepID=UPI001D691E13|nr:MULTISPECIES: sulfotransferase [unclassified Microcoleus]MCC3528793.1 sulfotransferase [Microcoleus sp. PH2017_21_RUC_O_A]MCC3540971.1 sulfotransferase [Microcoleus sp. PH2017_22_RUC_O_B]
MTLEFSDESLLQGKNLIFLISQPRAGSTLTQRMLGSHCEIHTVSEPWLMLHPLYAMRSEGYEVEYNAQWASNAVEGFVDELPEGKEAYFKGLRRMYSYLYNCAATSSGKTYFLDKTPRYYFIISELYNIFPEAHFIILLRNPLSVLCSMINTWTQDDYFKLHLYKQDLLEAPAKLIEGTNLLNNHCLVLHYEWLLLNPEAEINKICSWLGIQFSPEMIDYGKAKDYPVWRYGDQNKVYQDTKPDSQNIDKWIMALDNPQVWRVVNDYLEFLGVEKFIQLGYSYEEMRNLLDSKRPQWFDLWRTLPLEVLVENPQNIKDWKEQQYFTKLISSINQFID